VYSCPFTSMVLGDTNLAQPVILSSFELDTFLS
jgi:hypothetical protein